MLKRSKLSLLVALFNLVFFSAVHATNEGSIIVEHPKNIAQCVGGSEVLYVVLDKGVVATFQWQFSDDNVNWKDVKGANLATYLPDANETKTAFYRVAVTTNETIFSKSAEVRIAEKPSVFISADSQLKLKATFKGGAGKRTIQWQEANSGQKWTNIEGANQEEFKAPKHTRDDMKYSAKVTFSGSGCCN